MKTRKHPENERPIQPDPHQKRSVLWIGLIFFISGWVFFLGVIVGRGTAPALFDQKKIDIEIKKLAKAFSDSQKAKNDTETDLLTTQAELGYPEELKKPTEDIVKIPMLTPTPAPAPEKAARPAEIPKPAPLEPAQAPLPSQPPVKSGFQVADKPVIENPPDATKTVPEVKIKSMYDIKSSQAMETVPEHTPAAAPARTPAAIAKHQPAVSDNKTTAAPSVAIRLSSLVDRKSADALIASLQTKGISASKTPKMVPGKGVWYVVVIGKYSSLTEADAMLNRLKQENVDASIVGE